MYFSEVLPKAAVAAAQARRALDRLAGEVDERLRVEVLDPGNGFTADGHRPPAEAESGWGLHFVATLADRWAAESGERGRVWFELMSR